MNKDDNIFNNIYESWSDIISQISYSDVTPDDDSEYVRYVPPSINIFVLLYENIFCYR